MEMTVKGWRGFHYGLAVAFAATMVILIGMIISRVGDSDVAVAKADFRVITYDRKDDGGKPAGQIHVLWTGIDNLDRNVTELMRLLGSAGWEEADDKILRKGSLLPIGCSIHIVASEKSTSAYPYVLSSGCGVSRTLMSALYQGSERERCLGIRNTDRRCGSVSRIGMS